VRRAIPLAIALAIALLSIPGVGDEPEIDLWDGAGALIAPLGDPTPIRVDELKADFHAFAPPKRRLDDPRFAAEWEVSTRMMLTNGSDAKQTLTLGLPQRAADNPDGPPPIDHVVISLDHRRMRNQRVDEPGPEISGAPPLVVRHKVSIEFEPGQTRRVDALFRVRAPFRDGAVRFCLVLGGAAGFADGTIGRAIFQWHFGDRVRLALTDGEKLDWIAAPPAGTESSFFDDGRKTRLLVELEKLSVPSTLQLAATAVGSGADRDHPILGQMRPFASMSPLELELARKTLLALYGRMFRDEGMRQVFEDRPWSDCNPAYRVAHGIPIEESSLDEFLATHKCSASCVEDRARPVDPYGPAWDEPLCWYALEHNLSLTRVTDPEIKRRIRAIEQLQRAAEQHATAAEKTPARGSGCQCRGPGRERSATGLLALVLSALLEGGR